MTRFHSPARGASPCPDFVCLRVAFRPACASSRFARRAIGLPSSTSWPRRRDAERPAVAPSAGRLPDPELVVAVDNLPINTAIAFLHADFMTMRRIGHATSHRAKRRLQAHARQEMRLPKRSCARRVRPRARPSWIAPAVAEDATTARSIQANFRRSRPRRACEWSSSAPRRSLRSRSCTAGRAHRCVRSESSTQAELARWIGDAADRPLAPFRPIVNWVIRQSLLAADPQHAPLAPLIAQLDAATRRWSWHAPKSVRTGARS